MKAHISSILPRALLRLVRRLAAGATLGTLALTCSPAAAQALPTVSCASPGWIFNTGVDAGGAKLAQYSAEPRWQWAVHPIEDVDVYTAPAQWNTPVAVRLTGPVWNWSDSGDSGWISPTWDMRATKYTYYRFRFNMDPAQNPAAFQVGFDFNVDDHVMAAFINGTKVNSQTPLSGLGFQQIPAGSGVYYTTPAQFTVTQGWQAGPNEMVLLVKNFGGSTLTTPTIYGGVAVRGRSMCGKGSAKISKSFAPTQVQSGGTSTLTIHVENQTTNPQEAVRELFVKDVLPAPLELAGTPTTTCQNAAVTGDTSTQTITLVNNKNPVSLTDDMLPTGGCDITVPVRWPASAAAQCNASVTNTITPGAAAGGGQFSTALGFDPIPATAALACIAPNLGITKSAPSPALAVGVESTYTLTVTNNGAIAAAGATVAESLPAGLTLVSATGTNWSCNSATPMACTYSAAIAANAQATPILVKVKPQASTAGTSVTNYASVDPLGTSTPPTPGETCAPSAACAHATSNVGVAPVVSPVPTLSQWALAMLALSMAWLAWGQRLPGARRGG